MEIFSIEYEFGSPVDIIINPESNSAKLLETIKSDEKVVKIWKGSLLGPSHVFWKREF